MVYASSGLEQGPAEEILLQQWAGASSTRLNLPQAGCTRAQFDLENYNEKPEEYTKEEPSPWLQAAQGTSSRSLHYVSQHESTMTSQVRVQRIIATGYLVSRKIFSFT